MNRRKFLERTGALSVALAGLPLAVRKNKQIAISSYANKTDNTKAKRTGYTLELYHNAIRNFETATAGMKVVSVWAFYYEEPEQIRHTKKFHYTFTMTDVSQDKKDENFFIIKTTGAKRIESDLEWPKDLPANPVIRIKIDDSAALLNKSGKSFIDLKFQSPSDDDDMGCFITTACVAERGLADDCDELETLRFLRKNYMQKTVQGSELLREYFVPGPSVVSAIAECENRSEIYDYLYQQMIIPAVRMIKKGDYQQAVDWYEGFAATLKKKYC